MKTLGLSSRAGMLKPSPTLGITARANAMKAAGVDLVSFAAGEPDFNTPDSICEAAIEAIRSGFTRYTPTSGIAELKEAIADKLKAENGITVKPDQVVASCGAKHSVYNALMVLLDPGDEVVLVAPYWMTYAEQVKLAGGVPVVIHTDSQSGFVPAYDQIREALTPRTKAIVVNSPGNPTGAVFGRDTLKEIAMLALRHDLWVVADEIYDRLVYDAQHVSMASLGGDIADRTITVGGVSKTYAMTGWRLGFAAAPPEVARAMSCLQDQVTSNPTSFVQKAAAMAYRMDQQAVGVMREEFQARRDLIVGLLGEIPGAQTRSPQGAFYVFPNFSSYLGGRISNDQALCEYLLDEARVATVPGSVFEGPGHLRLSYACSREDIERGVGRVAQALQTLGA